jgi:predicted nucleotidyltransferase
MLNKQECIDKIKSKERVITHDFGVNNLLLFGSVARDEAKESSDVDVFVDMAPDL